MNSYIVSHQAYVKIALHAAKYPHSHVNGILLGTNTGSVVNIVDSVPLLHHWTSLSPSMEIGLDLARNHAQSLDLQLVGYYQAAERLDDNVLVPVGERVAENIKKSFPQAIAFVVDGMNLGSGKPALVPYLPQGTSASWRPTSANCELASDSSPTRVLQLIRESKLQYKFGDFDDHLEDVSIDWLRNSECKDE